MKKSVVLTVVPAMVLTATGPDVDAAGTGTVRVVAVAAVGVENATFRLTRSLAGAKSKFVPVIVSAPEPVQICGDRLVIVGAPTALETTNTVALVAEPFGVVTETDPVVAPAGTVTASCVVLAADTVDAVPLNVTVFEPGDALKPLPYIVTDEPIAALCGATSLIDVV